MKRTAQRAPRKLLAAIATGALALGAVVATPLTAQAAQAQVDDVTFDWGINNESTGGAYFGACNFLSAGVAGDSGSSRVWGAGDGLYKSSDGNTTIVRPNADRTGLVQPSFADKCKTPEGVSVAGKTNAQAAGNHTESRVQISGGTGTVDVAAKTAAIQWTGSFTVAYYGGMTYWSASDPKLVVNSDGTGTVTASLSGYAADMDNPDVWNRLQPRDVVIADLKNVAVTPTGITVTPEYLGVAIPSDVAGRNAQAVKTSANESWWGAFPGDFVRFQQLTGQSSYWFTTDGPATSIQPRKATTPLTVTYRMPTSAVITTQPAAQTATLGETATFSVVATDATGYRWQSAATGTSAWADVAGATSASLSVAATTANAMQYRVIVTGAAGDVTSDAATLTVNVPTPTVTVSKTSGLDPAGETVTVKGTGFLENAPATNGARPPLAGRFSGAYIVIGKFADTWKPSQGAPGSARKADPDATRWGVHAADVALAGGANAGAVVIAEDGTFEVTLTAKKDFSDAPATGNYGVYTYPGGSSGYAAFETATPISFAVPAPAAPAAPTAALGQDGSSVDVTWVAPADNGSAITGYDVTLTPTTGAPIVKAVAADVTSASFTGLARGVGYTATVVANNAGGSSPASAASATVQVPVVAPAAPAAPTATASTTSVAVSWAAPADNGSALTGYTVTVRKGDEVVTTASVDAATTATQIDGLSRATAYTVTVAAKNGGGTSAESAASAFTTLAAAPAAPTNVTLALEATSGSVTWTLGDDGGSALLSHVVKVYKGSELVQTLERPGTASFANLTGLDKGTAYTATVTAVSAAGQSVSAASPAATTLAEPSAVTGLAVALSGGNDVRATWTPGSDGGSAVTGYVVTLKVDGVDQPGITLDASAREHVFTGLSRGKGYAVQVVAVNAIGSSAAAVSGAIVIPAAPGVPASTAVTAGADGTSVRVDWTAPVADGGSAVTGYRLALDPVAGGAQPITATVGADARSHTFTGLAKGGYRVFIVAENAIGLSDDVAAGEVAVPGAKPATTPVLLSEVAFTSSSSGPAKISVDKGAATIDVGTAHANEWIGVSVHSTPVFLGWFATDAAGRASVTLPADLPAGTHHLVAYAADGSVLGYQAFAIEASPAGGAAPAAAPARNLAVTGTDAAALWPLAGFGFLVLAAGAALVIRRRFAA